MKTCPCGQELCEQCQTCHVCESQKLARSLLEDLPLTAQAYVMAVLSSGGLRPATTEELRAITKEDLGRMVIEGTVQ